MEGILFWLVPVLLLIVFTLVLLHHGQDTRKSQLLLVEPIGTLVESWHLARLIGDQKLLGQFFDLYQQTASGTRSVLETILAGVGHNHPRSVVLLHTQRLSLWGEQRVFETNGKILSVVIGDASEVLPLVNYGAIGKQLLTAAERAELERVAQAATQHGYLVMACAYRYVHGQISTTPTQHSWAGFILLEPTLSELLLKRLRTYRRPTIKLLSVLPTTLLDWMARKIWRSESLAGIDLPSSSPREREEYWEQAGSIGSADLRERYSAVRYFQFGKNCRVLSGNAEDAQLPVPVTRLL